MALIDDLEYPEKSFFYTRRNGSVIPDNIIEFYFKIKEEMKNFNLNLGYNHGEVIRVYQNYNDIPIFSMLPRKKFLKIFITKHGTEINDPLGKVRDNSTIHKEEGYSNSFFEIYNSDDYNYFIDSLLPGILNENNLKEDDEIETIIEQNNDKNDIYPINSSEFLSENRFDIEKIIQEKGNFFDYLSDKNLIFNYKVVENYLLSLKVKPFVILTGNSGTGKTRISKEFVDYLDCNLSIVPVGSNWTDNHNIIGYYNPFTKDYFKPESYKIIESAEKSDKPSFLVLDEMNLSHVEHYFSDMLSAIESNVSIPLNVNREDVEMKDFLELTDKLFIVGTVNIDETTYMFSPKVLDRANTIEFKTTKPNEYLENNDFLEVSEECDIEFLTNPFDGMEVRNMSFEDIKNKFNNASITIHDAQRLLWDVLVELLDKFYETLEKSQFDFGFRVVNEILRFMYVAWIYEGKPSEFHNWDRYFDAQVKQKLLPKIHGSEYLIKDTLKGLKTLCEQYKLKTSNRKIDEMNKVLKEQKFVSFIN